MDQALEEMRAVRAALAGDDRVRHVCLGIAPKPTGWDYAVWVYADGPADDLARPDAPLPVVVFGPDPRCEKLDPEPLLQKRRDPPLGGYLVGPTAQLRGTFGLLGFIADRSKPVFCSAAHVFRLNDQVSIVARQPATFRSQDIISTSPIEILDDIDIVFYEVDLTARDWDRLSGVAFQGTLTGQITRPRIGLKVRKTGQKTGLTRGTVSGVGPGVFFTVLPDDTSRPLSCPGDSGSAWVDENLNWVGIHTNSLDGRAVAISAEDIFNRARFQPYGL
jgi:hypothetical protein